MALSKYVRSGGIKIEYPTVDALVKQGLTEGWKLQVSNKTGSSIGYSKAGNAQLRFINGKDLIFVRVSDNAMDAIAGGSTAGQLPVYEIELHEDGLANGKIIGHMLSIGINAADDSEWENAKPVDLATAFKVVKKEKVVEVVTEP